MRVHRAHMLHLSDLLKKSAPSRIVVVGSCGQWFGNMNPENPLDFKRYQFPLLNYCSTKVLNMLFTVELARRLEVEQRESRTRVLPNDEPNSRYRDSTKLSYIRYSVIFLCVCTSLYSFVRCTLNMFNVFALFRYT